ncbi:hypothetical protein MTR67_047834 [Solanum verrucosum]|uniref:Uncharacterized protein n=1 Tax=Solanum verrucosum TaxID=315347 RepID=A0AAF0UZR5_SOLVR|nr:hypothetical protein MTR67_047834 [Solanum verrucosum]
MQIFRSRRYNLRPSPTDCSLTYDICCGSVVHHYSPSQKPRSKNRLSLDPRTDLRSVVCVRRSRLIYPASDTNYGRPAQTVVRCTVRRSDRR